MVSAVSTESQCDVVAAEGERVAHRIAVVARARLPRNHVQIDPRIEIFGSQPWPTLGSQLMLATFARADNTYKPLTAARAADANMSVAEAETVRLLDGELEAARWFTRDEVVLMVARSRAVPDVWNQRSEERADVLTVPPPVAIAHQMIHHWINHADDMW